jgi:hypothetical protein
MASLLVLRYATEFYWVSEKEHKHLPLRQLAHSNTSDYSYILKTLLASGQNTLSSYSRE